MRYPQCRTYGKIWLLMKFFISLLLFSSLFSEDFYSADARLSHTEPGGIGYKRGYTTLEGFLMGNCGAVYPYIDILGHGFNDRRLAANLGMGFRYDSDKCWVFGMHFWYDMRQGNHRDLDRVGRCYHQASFGIEALGPLLDFRFNFYQPVGKKAWNFTQIHFDDNSGITPIFSRKKQTTFKGFDAEVGGFIACGKVCCTDWSAYLAIGPYLIQEYRHHEKWGAKLRLATALSPYLTLEVRTSYDPLFFGSLQVRAELNFPLYPESSLHQQTCCLRDWFREWISQPVKRQEIMPLRSH